ncbi:MAG: tetratricopeptide repeat protein [Thermodesulfobacteriota bacterium]
MRAPLVFLLCLGACLLLNMPGLSGPMVFDSQALIQANEDRFAYGSIRDVVGLCPMRPVVMLSFYLDYLVAGMNPLWFRLVNVVVYAAGGLAVFLLVSALLVTPATEPKISARERTALALCTAVAFVTHPLQYQVVLYVWQRMALFACVFSLLSLLLYFCARIGVIRNSRLGYMACGLSFVMAVFSKENAVLLPVVVLAAEVLLFRMDLRRLLKPAAIGACVTGVVLITLLTVERLPETEEAGLFKLLAMHYRASGLSPLEIVLTQCRMLFCYLGIILAPFAATFPLVESVVISRSLVNPWTTLPAVCGVAGLVGISIATARSRPLLSFGLVFFLVTLVPESVAIPVHLFFAYRAVLPMVGVLLVLGDLSIAALTWADEHGFRRAVGMGLAAAAILWIAGNSAVTMTRATIWKDPLAIWAEAAEALPPAEADSQKLHYGLVLNELGAILRERGRAREAIPYHEKALRSAPADARSLFLLADAEAAEGDSARADQLFRRALSGKFTDPTARFGVLVHYGAFLEKQGDLAQAVDYYRQALDLNPRVVAWRNRMCLALVKVGEHEKSVDCFRKALAIQPGSTEAYYNLAAALQGVGRVDDAVTHYEKSLVLNPRYAAAHNNLGRIEESRGNLRKAIEHYQQAIRSAPTLAEAYYNLGNARMASDMPEEAIVAYRRALEIRVDYPEAHNNLAVLLEEQGHIRQAAWHYRKAHELVPGSDMFKENFRRAQEKLDDQKGPGMRQ